MSVMYMATLVYKFVSQILQKLQVDIKSYDLQIYMLCMYILFQVLITPMYKFW